MNPGKRKTLIIGFGGVLWLLAVFGMYAYTHKPFTPSQATLLVKVFWQMFVVFSFLSLAGGIGYKIFAPPDDWSSLAALAVQAALGFGVLGLLIFFLGVTIGFSSVVFIGFFILGVGFANRHILSWWKEWHSFSRIWDGSGAFDKLLAGGVGFVLFTTFLKSLAPPLVFDSLVYHLTLPKLYLLDGRFQYIPELIFWGMPQQLEMGMTFTMALGGMEAAVLLTWALGSLTLFGLLGYMSERFSTSVAWVALSVLLAGKGLADLLSWGYVEWTVMLYGFVLFAVLESWLVKQDKKLLWLAAALVGFAMGTKYTAGILLFAAVVVIVLKRRHDGLGLIVTELLQFSGIALLLFSPWLIKNFLATGNPIYPLLIPAGEMNAFRLELYQGDAAWGDWRDLAFLPWRATIWGIDGAVGYSAEIGALLLAFSPFAWLGWQEYSSRQKNALHTAFMITLVGFLLWAVAGRISGLLIQSRLYLAFFPAWAVLAGVGYGGFSKLRALGVRFGRISAALLFLSFGFGLYQLAVDFAALSPGKVLLGVQTPSLYRKQALGRYDLAMSTIAELPEDAEVLFLWETRGFSCVPKCEPDEVIDRWYADLRTYGDVDAVLNAWRSAGYRYLLFNKRGAEFIKENDVAYSERDWVELDTALSQLDLRHDFDGEYQIFALGE